MNEETTQPTQKPQTQQETPPSQPIPAFGNNVPDNSGTTPASQFLQFAKKHPKPTFIVCIILALILGFGCGRVRTVNYDNYKNLQTAYNTLKSEKESIKSEYDTYKEKMQPYEAVQLTDAQNKVEKERQELADKKAAEEKAAAEAKAQKEAEEKAAAEKKAAEEKAAAEARAAEEAKGYETGITFDNLARTPDAYKGKKVKFSGKVIQVVEGTTETQIRLAIDGDYDKVVFCRVPKAKTSSTRILEDDYIHIMGVSNGLISYQSTMGGTITIPDISVDDWGQG